MRHFLRLDHAAGLIGGGTACRAIDGKRRKPLGSAQIVDHGKRRGRLVTGAGGDALVGGHGHAGGKNGAGGKQHETAPGKRVKRSIGHVSGGSSGGAG